MHILTRVIVSMRFYITWYSVFGTSMICNTAQRFQPLMERPFRNYAIKSAFSDSRSECNQHVPTFSILLFLISSTETSLLNFFLEMLG